MSICDIVVGICRNKCRWNYTYNSKKAFVNFVYCLLSFQRKMRFYLKKFFSVCILLCVVFVWWGFSYEASTQYTDFSFAWNLKNYTFYALGWETKTISFYLTNNSDSTISGNFGVVDAVDMWWWLLACKSNWQNEVFWKYGAFQQTWFLLWANETLSGSFDMKFPEGYSWEYLWCLTYTPSWNEETGYLNFQPRKALFLKAVLNATASLYQLKVFPWSRSKSSLANIWEIRFYDNNLLVYSNENVESDSGWFASFSALIPDGIYTIVYKWQSHLASYLYDVPVIAWTTFMFDFTSWLNLSWVQNYTNTTDNWSKYQIAWDLKNTEWKYDFTVNWNDIAIITVSWFVAHVDDLDPRDLNWDNVINVSDLAIIWANFEQEDVFFNGHMYNWLR